MNAFSANQVDVLYVNKVTILIHKIVQLAQ
jgi:hypothetical protein